jgi:hypothetical protein
VWTAGRGGVGVAGWVTDSDLLERVELVPAALPDADHGSFAQGPGWGCWTVPG